VQDVEDASELGREGWSMLLRQR